ncbi:PaaI family thioesterase [Advenella sp. FME57]|uniref:PaaI family thioesterase n=1 Tax=Advenella sp. FME57 TaxID=2742604 RepID=UPI00186702F3|nr:PaaI family thioesterase [Advenella sp. FME57]
MNHAVSNEDVLKRVRGILARQPFSALLKTEATQASADGTCEFRICIDGNLMQHLGTVHGGVLGYAADTALTFAAGIAYGIPVITSEFKINFLRPVVGEVLVAKGHVVYKGRTQAVTRCDLLVVKDGEEKLCATAQGTIVVLPESTGSGA